MRLVRGIASDEQKPRNGGRNEISSDQLEGSQIHLPGLPKGLCVRGTQELSPEVQSVLPPWTHVAKAPLDDPVNLDQGQTGGPSVAPEAL